MATTKSSSSKLCDSCKSTASSLFCRADSAYLCYECDSKIHAANNLAARHCRVLLCDVCEQAPAHVTCKADAANLCVTCDLDIHSANPLARRHVRVAISAFSDSAVDLNVFDDCGDLGLEEVAEDDREEEEASWLVSSLNPVNCGKIGEDMDSYFDFEYGFVDEKSVGVHVKDEEEVMNLKSSHSQVMDCVVPVQQPTMKKLDDFIADGDRYGADSCFDFDFLGSKAFYTNNGQALSHSVSSSSFDVGLVPDSIAMIDVSNPFGRQTKNVSEGITQAVPSIGVDREARVLRYREKRKNRKFEKTIRYASRKAYAETRPRIKGRFVKRTDTDNVFESQHGLADLGYGIVPSF